LKRSKKRGTKVITEGIIKEKGHFTFGIEALPNKVDD